MSETIRIGSWELRLTAQPDGGFRIVVHPFGRVKDESNPERNFYGSVFHSP